MSTVYVVTTGDYSDYHICAICSTMELANEARAVYASEGAGAAVSAWDLDAFTRIPPGHKPYVVYMRRNGDVLHAYEGHDMDRTAAGHYRIFRDNKFHAYVFATSREHAIKIVNEKRTQLIATGQWKEVQ